MGGFFYESLTLNLAGTFFTDRKSGGGCCAEVTVNRGSTVLNSTATSTYEVPAKVLILVIIMGLQPETLPKTKLLHKYFSKTPSTSQKHLLF